jgi:hypothetical protein
MFGKLTKLKRSQKKNYVIVFNQLTLMSEEKLKNLRTV